MANENLQRFCDLDPRLSVGYVARAAAKQKNPKHWLFEVMGSHRLPDYVRYLVTCLLIAMERPVVANKK